MGIFSQYRSFYKQPERLSPEETRQRRLQSVLTRERERLEVQAPRLSPANKFHLNKLKEFEVKFGAELEARRNRMNELNRSNVSFYKKSVALSSARSRLFQLEQRREALRQNAGQERRKNMFQKSFIDRRMFSPLEGAFHTVFGTEAHIKHRTNNRSTAKRVFRTAGITIPCVDRLTRREVMFAKKHGGKGHRVRHRFSPLSLIGC